MMNPVRRRRLSIVIPVFNEERVLPMLFDELEAQIPTLGFEEVEVLFVSDGSSDATERIIAERAAEDSRYQGIFLTRNFGHQAAIWTGIERAQGDVVAVMDGDMQDPPEVLGRMIEALDAGAHVAYGVRTDRKESIWKRAAYAAFYRILSKTASIEIPLDTGDFCCMRQEVAEAMRQLPERTRFVRGLRAWVGFKQVGVEYRRGARAAGVPGYSLTKLIGLAYDGLFSFSSAPIRLIQVLGFSAALGSLSVGGGYAIWYFVQTERFPTGFATVTVSIWLLAGLQFLFLGIVGEYVARGLTEARARPVALVREVVGNTDSRGPASAG